MNNINAVIIIALLLQATAAVVAQHQQQCGLQCAGTRDPVPFFKHPAPKSRFESNGCGSGGIKVSVDPKQAICCDIHDGCYSICGLTQSFCDAKFKKCLESKCDPKTKEYDDCMGSANMMSMGTSMFGCAAFTSSQQEACECVETKTAEEGGEQSSLTDSPFGKRFRAFLHSIYDVFLHSSVEKSREQIDQIAERALTASKSTATITKNKNHKAAAATAMRTVFNIVEKYPEQTIDRPEKKGDGKKNSGEL